MKTSSYMDCEEETSNILKIIQVLRVLSAENRLKVFCVLKNKSYCVCELVEYLGLEQSLLSHHLSDLKRLHLVESVRKGQKIYYSLTKKGIEVFNLLGDLSKEV